MSSPNEPYLRPATSAKVSTQISLALELLRQVRSTLAAAQQPEHARMKELVNELLDIKGKVGMRASRGAANARYEQAVQELAKYD